MTVSPKTMIGDASNKHAVFDARTLYVQDSVYVFFLGVGITSSLSGGVVLVLYGYIPLEIM